MDRLSFELRLAVRRLLARPGFLVTAVLSLGLGIGASTVFFSLLNSTLLKPLPVERPSELFSLVDPRFGAPVISNPNIRDLRKRSGAFFSYLLPYRIVAADASIGAGANSRIWGYQVSGDYFEGLGVKAALGRTLTMEDDRTKGAHPYAVLTDAAWRKRFGADPQVIGRKIKLNGFPFTIVGVAPRGFLGTERFYAPEIFTTWAMIDQVEAGNSGYDNNRDAQNTFTVARIKSGMPMAQVQAGLDNVTAQLAREYPKQNEGFRLHLTEPGWAGDFLRGSVLGFNVILMALGGSLLLVVCINLANLLLAQASERRKETAVRLAIGAGRAQLIRQLLLESLVLAALGGGLGLLLAMWSVDAISHYKPPIDFSIQTEFHVDYGVALFSALVTLLTSLMFGLVPAWQATKLDLASAIKNDVADERQRRWPLRDLLVGAQIAMSIVLLVCSGLMLKSLSNALSVNVGFETKGAGRINMSLSAQHYNDQSGRQFENDLVRRVRELPGVASAAVSNSLPLDLNLSNNTVYETGQPEPPASKMPSAQVFTVSPDFFKTMKTRLLAGREFDPQMESLKARRGLVVNRQFIRTILKLENPEQAIGKRVETMGKTHEIIGVAEDGKYFGLSEAPKPVMFYSTDQVYESELTMVFRSSGAPVDDILKQVRKIVAELDPELTILQSETLEQHMNLPLLPARFAAGVITLFGMVTMLLAAVGIYGVTAFAVARRTREIGIRMAIGAAPSQIAQLVLTRATVLIGIGAIAGAVLAMLAAGLLRPILIGVNPLDLSLQAAGVLLMVAIALLACFIPARRAAGLDPSRSLRSD